MARYVQLTPRKKTKILTLSEVGKSAREIASIVGCSHSTVVRLLKKNRETGSVDRPIRKGLRRKTTPLQDRLLRRISLRNRFYSATDLRRELQDQCDVSISVQTIRRRLNEGGLFGRRAAKKPLLTQKMKAARLQWAKDHKNWTLEDWKNVIFSDESKFNLSGSDGTQYVRRRVGERFQEDCLQRTTRCPASIMVWGCFSYCGVGQLHFIEGTVNAKKYQDILRESLLPSIEEHFSRRSKLIFQDDCAPCHTAKSVQDFLAKLGISRMKWPGNSPDLNPIENLWAVMKAEIKNRKPRDLRELKILLENVWYDEAYSQIHQDLVASMPSRIQAVIAAKGGSTKY